MSFYQRGAEKRRVLQEYKVKQETFPEDIGSAVSVEVTSSADKEVMYVNSGGPAGGAGGGGESDKRVRREIANHNERRRMQSINAGFQNLKTLLPHADGDKMSKAAILQHTANHIHSLEQEKTTCTAQLSELKRLLDELRCSTCRAPAELRCVACKGPNETHCGACRVPPPLPEPKVDVKVAVAESPPAKRRKRDTEVSQSSDEGIGTDDAEKPEAAEHVCKDMLTLRKQLECERRMRLVLEEQTKNLNAQLNFPEKLRKLMKAQADCEQKYAEERQKLDVIRDTDVPTPVVTSQQQQVTAPQQQKKEEATVARKATPRQNLPAKLRNKKQGYETESSAGSPQAQVHRIMAPPPVRTQHPPAPQPQQPPVSSSDVSRRNLSMLVEALRHLEGDSLFSGGGADKVAAAACGGDCCQQQQTPAPSSTAVDVVVAAPAAAVATPLRTSPTPPTPTLLCAPQPRLRVPDCEEPEHERHLYSEDEAGVRSDYSTGRDSPSPPLPRVEPFLAPVAPARVKVTHQQPLAPRLISPVVTNGGLALAQLPVGAQVVPLATAATLGGAGAVSAQHPVAVQLLHRPSPALPQEFLQLTQGPSASGNRSGPRPGVIVHK